MNITAYLTILAAFAIGYILGAITTKLLKTAVSIIIFLAVVVGFYLYFLR